MLLAMSTPTPNQEFLPIPAGRNSGLSIWKISINVKIERNFFCSKTNEVTIFTVWCAGFSAYGRGAEPEENGDVYILKNIQPVLSWFLNPQLP